MTTRRMAVLVCVVIAVAATSTHATPWTWTSLNHPGASNSCACGIDGNNIVGRHQDSNGDHGFLFNGKTWTTPNYPGELNTSAEWHLW